VLSEMNVGVPFGILNIAFDPNTYDTHTLVELYNADTGRWMVLDPTFDLAPRRGDGEWATAEELRAATLASDWTGVSYDFLGAEGDYWVRHYYLDYPLLYFNVYHESDPMPVGSGTSPAGVLVPAPLPTTTPDFYLAQCAAGTASTQALVNGTLTDLACNGIDGLTKIFFASSVAAPAGGAGTFQLYRTPRFVF